MTKSSHSEETNSPQFNHLDDSKCSNDNELNEIESNENESNEVESIVVDAQFAGERLDKTLAHYFPDLSRSRLQEWIKNQQVTIDDEVITKPKHKLIGGETLIVEISLADQGEWRAIDLPLNIHYQDDDLIIINKPVGLVVHPAPGHYDDTLVNGLLFHFPALRKLPRAGIVHRLDRDTSGLLVVAKTPEAHNNLVEQLQQRAFSREYLALVHGILVAGDTIDLPMGRHPISRKKMAVIKQIAGNSQRAKEAITHYRVEEKFGDFTLVKVNLETGRTHQIRVHFSHLKHPLVGDPLYGVRNQKPKAMSEEFTEIFDNFRRQALHARSLGLAHPASGEWVEWSCDLPADMQELLSAIREHDRMS